MKPYIRRCIRIKATDSPNVKFGLWEREQNWKPSGRMIVPGVLSWEKYQIRLQTYNEQQLTESIEADWYEGAALKLVQQSWIDAAVKYNALRPKNDARVIGCDPGEGGDDTCWVVGGWNGIDEVVSMKTPDTNKVIAQTMLLQDKWDVPWESIVFDLGSGGGGRVHVDRFWANGKRVRGVGFGQAPQIELRRGITYFGEKRENKADKAAFVHCRDEMAHDIRCLLERDAEGNYIAANPGAKVSGFGIPGGSSTEELRRQLALIPFSTDGEGRMKLPPKKNPLDPRDPDTLSHIVGHSPDQFDAMCLMGYGLTHKPPQQRAGVH